MEWIIEMVVWHSWAINHYRAHHTLVHRCVFALFGSIMIPRQNS
jgi:hypothetical protein